VIWNYVQLPLPGKVVAVQMAVPLVEMAICGAIVGAIYKPRAKHAGRLAR